MIQILIKKNKLGYESTTMKGHAKYDDFGKDIVCAGASSILTTTVNAILSFDDKAIKIEENNPFILKVLKSDEITSKLIENMISLFKELEENYPKNISVREDETNE